MKHWPLVYIINIKYLYNSYIYIIIWGCHGFDCDENGSTTRRQKCQMSLNLYKTITDVELSTWTFDDVMSFMGADLAVAA